MIFDVKITFCLHFSTLAQDEVWARCLAKPSCRTHNMRISFHKAHLYKSIRFIFTCGKGLYSQSEWSTAISHVEV